MPIGKSVFLFFTLFLIGVFLFGVNIEKNYLLLIVSIAICLFILIFLFYNNKKYLLIGVLMPSILFGYYYALVYKNITYKEFDFVPKSKIEISARVISNPKYTPTSVSFITKTEKGEKILVISKPYYLVKYNDSVNIYGQIDILGENQNWAKERYVFGQFFYPEKITVTKNASSPLGFLYDFQNKFASIYKKINYSNEGALAGGILLGDSGAGFTKDFTDKLKKSGTSHIIALSGYNITILVIMISSIASFFVSRKKSFWITSALILIFTIMTGASASVVRAALMGYLILLAQRESRVFNFPNAVAFSAFVMILFNPNVLTFDTGFLLSFLALFGITYISPIIFSLANFKNSFMQEVWNIFTQTFGAQLVVIPVLCKLFGGFSIISLISNTLILWFIPIAMAFSFILGVIGLFGGVLVNIISIIFYPLFGYIIFIIKTFGSFNITSVNMGYFGIFLYYLVLVFIIIKYYRRSQEDEFKNI